MGRKRDPMANQLELKAWLIAERAAVHGEIVLQLASRRFDRSPALAQVQRIAHSLREEADAQFREIIREISQSPPR